MWLTLAGWWAPAHAAVLKLMARRCVNKTVADIAIYLAILMGTVGVGFLHAAEDVIILGKVMTAILAEWDKPVHFGTGNWSRWP
jgi:hypothetical protein